MSTLNLPDGHAESEDVWVSANGVRYCSHCGATLSDPFQDFGDYGPHGDEGCDVCLSVEADIEDHLRANGIEP